MKKNNKLKENINAFFVVEASIISPFVFVIILLCILLMFFLYNHCILFQSCYLAALRGQQIKEVSDAGIEKYVTEELRKLLEEQIYEYQADGRTTVSVASITVNADENIGNKLKNYELYKEASFTDSREVQLIRYNPSEFIRKNNLIFDR